MPDLGAGGLDVAGSDRPEDSLAKRAVLHDQNPLTRAAAVAALRSLCRDCRECGTTAPCADTATGDVLRCLGRDPVRLVAAHGLAAVAGCPLRRSDSLALCGSDHRTDVLYVVGDRLAGQLHLLHGCADAVAVLRVDDDCSRFELLEDAGPLAAVGLTPREIDVLSLLLARATNDEIAAGMVVSLATVRAHCRSVLRKLGASRRQDLWRMFARGPE
jgi:DNA-binding CsgD family transcriptional regulator